MKSKKEFSAQYPLERNTVNIFGVIDDDMAERVIAQLQYLEDNGAEEITIQINSPGGSVSAGFAIYDMIRFVNCPVVLVGNGLIASAAALILLAVPKERRVGFANSEYLIHQPLSGMRGTATEIVIHAENLTKTKAKINKIIAEATGKDFKQVEKDTDRDHWLDAEEAKEYGLIGKIITSRNELKEIK